MRAKVNVYRDVITNVSIARVETVHHLAIANSASNHQTILPGQPTWAVSQPLGCNREPPLLEERRNRQDLIEVFKICKGFSRIRPEELFQFDDMGKGTRGLS